MRPGSTVPASSTRSSPASLTRSSPAATGRLVAEGCADLRDAELERCLADCVSGRKLIEIARFIRDERGGEESRRGPARAGGFLGSHAFSRVITRYHALSRVITRYHTLSHVITRYHTLSHVITRYHAFSRVLTRSHAFSRVLTRLEKTGSSHDVRHRERRCRGREIDSGGRGREIDSGGRGRARPAEAARPSSTWGRPRSTAATAGRERRSWRGEGHDAVAGRSTRRRAAAPSAVGSTQAPRPSSAAMLRPVDVRCTQDIMSGIDGEQEQEPGVISPSKLGHQGGSIKRRVLYGNFLAQLEMRRCGRAQPGPGRPNGCRCKSSDPNDWHGPYPYLYGTHDPRGGSTSGKGRGRWRRLPVTDEALARLGVAP